MKHKLYTIILVLLCILVIIFISSAYYFKLKWTGYETKTLWDWMDLLIVPAVLAIGALIYNRNEKKVEQQRAEEHARSEREIAQDNQRETVLQSHLSAMAELMLNYNLVDRKVITIAQARTAGVLNRLDDKRKITLLQFLADAELINAENPVIRLSGSDFSNIKSIHLSLSNVSLEGINFSGCNLNNCTFSRCNCRYVDFTNTDLSETNLFGSDFCGAYLTGTIFSNATIFNADFSKGRPRKASMDPKIAKEITRKAAEEWLEDLNEAIFTRAKYDYSTKWPANFNPQSAGAVNWSD